MAGHRPGSSHREHSRGHRRRWQHAEGTRERMNPGEATSPPFATAALTTRIAFLLELARRLHQYGTTAPRLEIAIAGAARRMGLAADVWSSPTAIIISFADLAQGEEGVAQSTQVMRLAPGDVNLTRLCEADRIADLVITGDLELREGFHRLRQLGRPDSRRAQAAVIASYGLSAASIVALFLHSSWADLLVAGCIGLVIGGITAPAATGDCQRGGQRDGGDHHRDRGQRVHCAAGDQGGGAGRPDRAGAGHVVDYRRA